MLEALGNLGDFIGGLAVVVTLIYLAIQVRQNTQQLRESAKLARLQARDSSFRSFSDFRSKIVSNSDVAELYLKGLRDLGSLESTERLRFNLLAGELFNLLQNSVLRLAEIGIDDVNDTIQDLGVDSILRAPGHAQWWKLNRQEFRDDFVALIDARIEALESPA